jgi:hypothetical protein
MYRETAVDIYIYIYGFCCNLLSHGCGFDIWAFLVGKSCVFLVSSSGSWEGDDK